MGALAKPLGASLCAQVVAALSALTPPVFAVVAAPDLGIAAAEVGGFTTLLFLGATASAVASGGFVARLGAIRISQICLLFCAAGMALVATGSLVLGALGGLLVGLGYGPMTPASSHLLSRVTTEQSRPFVFSFKQTSVPVGGALAGLMVPALVATVGWQGAALAVSAIGLGVAVLLIPLRRELDGPSQVGADGFGIGAAITAGLRAVKDNPRLRRLGFVSLAFSAMQICFATYFVTYLVEDVGLGLGLVFAGLALSVGQGAGIAGRLFWGAMAERVITSRRLLGALGLVMSGAAIALAAVTAGWPLTVVLLIAAAFGASAVGWNGIYLAEIVRITSAKDSATATSGVLLFTFGGMMLGPTVFGVVVAAGGFAPAWWVAAAITLIPGVMLFRADRRRQRIGA